MKIARPHAAALLALLCAAAPAPAAAPQAQRLPPVATAERDGFGVVQLSTVDPDRLNAQWRLSNGDVSLTTENVTLRNLPIHTFILFKGCTQAADGNCHVTAEYWVHDPAGKLYGYTKGLQLWKAPKPAGRAYAMGENKVSMRVENGERLGIYTLRFRTTDEVARVTVETDAEITVAEAK